MAAFATTRKAPFGAVNTYRFFQFFGALFAAVVEWNDARVTRATLERLTDRELDDIGLNRGDITLIGAKGRF